ncbi:uncharacterized protein LOC144861593, partial [Branchiostoma floridae x Branchiostoma japonicum]
MYGAGCTQTCHCASGGSVCDVMTGACSSGGCEAGWMGNNCQTVCSPGEFGPECTFTCHCASGGSVCDVMTGVCSSGGCEAGWKGSNCQTACTVGEFGPDCNGTCHCASGDSVCDVMTGVCSSGGCEAGWKGSNCQTACTVGEFGPDCTGTCHCASGGSVCDVMTGLCSSGGCEAGWKGSNCQEEMLAPQDCTDMFALGIQYSHVYTVGYPQPFQAYCDMDTDGGGWTVIQRRQDGSVLFNKTWAEYEQGFGNASGEYWLGLGTVYSLTTQKQNELYVYLEDWEMNSRFARYSTFSVGDAGSKYTATIDGYSGDAGDSLDPSDQGGRYSINNTQFSTMDQDNDGVISTDCAGRYGQGGWWYTPGCGWVMLNGQYLIG